MRYGKKKIQDDMIAGEKQRVVDRFCFIITEMIAWLYAAEKVTTQRARENIELRQMR